VSLALTDTGGSVVGVDLVSNTFRKSAEGAARPYTGVLAGYWINQIHAVRLLDTRLQNGATANIVWVGTGLKDVAVGWLLTVQARDAAGGPVAGAAVSVRDRGGVQVYAGTTGSDGAVHDVPLVTTVYRQTTTDPRAVTTDKRGPFEVLVGSGGRTATATIDPAASLTLTLTLG